jgi:NTE family protein
VDAPVIAFIDIDNRTKLADRRLRGGIRQRLGEPLDVQQIEDDFTKLYGLGVFEQIDYALVERDGKTGLQVVATEKTWAKDYLRLGLALESDMDGESSYVLGFGVTLTALNAFGAEWRNEVAFGNTQRLITEFYQPLQPETGFYALASAGYTRADGRVTGADGNTSEYRTTRGDVTVALGHEWGTFVDTRLGLRFGGGDVDRRAGSGGGVDTGSFRVGSLDARLIFDTLDNVHFPNDGTLVRMNLGASRQELGADTDYTKLDAGALQAYTWDANTVIAGITGGTALNGSLPTHDRLQLGGLFSVSGYSRNELSTENLLRGNLIYLRRLSERSSMFLDLPLYAGASFEAARLDGTAGGDFDRDVFGGSVFLGADTPLGAGYLALGQGDGGRTALYLYLGKLF